MTVPYWTLNLKVCIYVICVYDTGERSEPEKKDINKVKQPLDPLLAIRPNLWQIWGGGSGPPVPLWIRAWSCFKLLEGKMRLSNELFCTHLLQAKISFYVRAGYSQQRSIDMDEISVKISKKWFALDESLACRLIILCFWANNTPWLTSSRKAKLEAEQLLVSFYFERHGNI